MSLLPQINNEINSSVKTEVTLPSKTYRLKVDSTALQLQKGNKTTVSGSEIKLTDVKFTQENKTSIKVKGSTSQVTRSGKNKLDAVNPTGRNYATAIVENDIVTVSSTATNTTPYVNYEFDVNQGDVVRFNSILINTNSQIVLQIYKTSWVTIGEFIRNYIDGVSTSSIVYTVESGISKVRVLLYSNSTIPTGNSSARYKNTIVTINNDDMSYEPYGASPSPDYPSPIENVEGNVEIKNVGENLLNVTATSRTYSEGVTITVNKDKSITISGTNTSTNTRFYRLADNFVLPAGDYTLSNKNANVSNDSFIFYDDGNNFPRTNISNATFTKDTTIKPYIKITARQTVNNQTVYPMILKGTYTEETIPVYKPYQEQKVTFPLSEGQKLMEGSYLADDGIHNVRGQIIIDGSKNINYSNFEGLFWIGISVLGISYKSIYGLCNYFSNVPDISITDNSTANTVLKDGEFAFRNGNTKDRIYFKHMASGTDKNNFQTWLSQNPITVEYELAEPEIVPYTAEQQEAYNQLNDYELFDGVNYITMISTIPGTLSLAYYDKNNINLIKTEEDRIVGFVDNLEAVKQSIYHILSIERYAYLIYDDNYGVEFEQYIGKDFDYVNATIENTLQEALLYDLRILDVSVDNIEQIDINKVAINFTVDTIYGNLVMEVSIDV